MHVSEIQVIPVYVPSKPPEKELSVTPYVGGVAIAEQPEDLSFKKALERCSDESARSCLLLRIETDTGAVGWGELPGAADAAPMVRRVLKEIIEPKLIGHPVWNVEALIEEFSGDRSALGYRDPLGYFGGIEMAMWDALGKEEGKPVYRLLGGKVADRVPVAFCIGITSIEEACEKAKVAKELGFDVIKTKGCRYWRRDVERLIAMHNAVDGELDFRVDPNQMWSPETAVRVGAKLEQAGVHLEYLEQPIETNSFGALKRLRQRLTQPIAINEDAFLAHNVYHTAKEDAIDAAVVDLQPVGGFLALKRLAGLAKEANISLVHHSDHGLGIKNAAKAHAYASIPQFDLAFDCTLYAASDSILQTPLEINGGKMAVPDGPGLVNVDEKKVDEYRME